MAKNMYSRAGVDLRTSGQIKENIKSIASKTYDPQVLGGVGGFGAMYRLSGYRDPVLVSSTDPIGTKLSIANMLQEFGGVGKDLVHASINDLIVCGADPLFFLDYIATSKLEPDVIEIIVSGIVDACCEIGCVLIGGETSEMPGIFSPGRFDVSGFVVGVAEYGELLCPKETIEPGDVLIGLPSNGLHTNGFSLVRHVFDLDSDPSPLFREYDELDGTLGKALLTPHPSYYHSLKSVLALVKGIAHITGGGLYENMPRILPDDTAARFHHTQWECPPIFGIIQRRGDVATDEMFQVFNMGLGMVIVCGEEEVLSVRQNLPGSIVVGEITYDPTNSVKVSIIP